MFEEMANGLAKFGGVLRCRTCGKEAPIDSDRIRMNMAGGWPKCCGLTMEWITAAQLAAQSGSGEGEDHGEEK